MTMVAPPRRAAVLAGVAALAALAGCSGLKPYRDEAAIKNLTIRTATSSGSAFSSVRAELDVHSVDASCRTHYLGTVELDKPAVAVGLATDRTSYLVFNFLSSSFLGGTRGRISRETVLEPQADARYEVDVTYCDDLYDVVLRERASPRGAAREVPLRSLASCR